MSSNNICIYGAAKRGYDLAGKIISNNRDASIIFCDGNVKKQGLTLCNAPVMSLDEFLSNHKDERDWDIIIAVNNINEVVGLLREKRIDYKVFCISQKYNYFKEGLLEELEWKDMICEIDIYKPELEYVEYHVSYHCNLKCKGCSHYSNVARPEFGDYDSYVNDILRLKELFWRVKKIRLLGGEPLLNRRLKDFVSITRAVFPSTDIRVVTNGLLISSVDETVLDEMHRDAAEFDITQYPPTRKIKEKIEILCVNKEVKYNFSQLVNEFFDIKNPKGDSKPEEQFPICVSRKCHFLENGKLSLCPRPLIYKRFKEELECSIPVMEEDVLDIYDSQLDGFKINEKFSKPGASCSYCDVLNKKIFAWQSEIDI